MKKIKRKLIFLAVSIVLCVTFTSCGKTDSDRFVGTWVYENEEYKNLMVIFSDGTGYIKHTYLNGSDISEEYSMDSWTMEEGKIKFQTSSGVFSKTSVCTYEFKNKYNKIDMVYDDIDWVFEYVRQ